MAISGDDFFDQLGQRGHEPALAGGSGTLRVEVVQGLCTEHWYLKLDNGDLKVSRENIKADAVLRIDRDPFDRVFGGGASLIPMMLRGEVDLEGEMWLIAMLERLLPEQHTSRPRQPSGMR